jgi:hypothetical protein
MAAYTWELLYRGLKPKRVQYTNAIVSYLDILGFRELINSKSAGEISQILRVLAESVEPHPSTEPLKIHFIKFSDTVIRITPLSRLSVAYLILELKSLVYAQMALIPHGVTVRGAVTIGEIVQSWGVAYGPAIVRAYDLERIEGGPPRIVIDKDAFTRLDPPVDIGKFESGLPGIVGKDGSTLFLDYLSALESALNVPEQEYSVFLTLHRDFIRANLVRYANEPKIRSKYEWLSRYHGRTLEERFGTEVPQHLNV